jgi:hypothetical protein
MPTGYPLRSATPEQFIAGSRLEQSDSNRGSHPGFPTIAAAGSRIPTASRSPTSVHSPTIRLTTVGGQYRRHQYGLERLSALALNDHAYDKLTGWSNVIPVVPVKGDATETYKFIKEESHGPRSTPHRRRS